MRLNKFSRIAMSTVAALVLAVGEGGTGVYAGVPTLSAADQAAIDNVRAQLTSFDIAPLVQQQLIKKLLSGLTLDSDNGSAPVSQSAKTIKGKTVTRYVYSDGSVAISSIEQPVVVRESTVPIFGTPQAGQVTPNSITGCTLYYYPPLQDYHYTFCLVNWNAATWSMSYYADYEYYTQGCWIWSLYGQHWGGIGSFTDAGLVIYTGHAGNAGTCYGQGAMIQHITIAGIGIARWVGLDLKVNNTWSPRARESAWGS